MNFKVIVFVAAIFLSGFGLSQAQLSWTQKEIELHPKAGDATAVAVFKYENKGKTPIKITSVKTSCGCTAASSKKDEVAPGETGDVTATFNIGGRTGVQQKAITVETTDAAQPTVNLMLKAVIEQQLEIQPTFVFWQSGEAPAPKMVVLKPAKDVKLTKVEVSSSNPDFITEVKKAANGEFSISIKPSDTAKPGNATLTIKTDLPQPFYVTARVTPAAAAAR